MQNPFLRDIEGYLLHTKLPVAEYDIHRFLKRRKADAIRSLGTGRLALFRRHFLVMNALYQIQIRLRQSEGLYLQISALEIRLLPSEPPGRDGSIALRQAGDAELSAWYLDWENYKAMSQGDVDRLLRDFWSRYEKWQNRVPALRQLGLSEDADLSEIRRRYRKLALLHHPDHGGDRGEWDRIQTAWEMLARD